MTDSAIKAWQRRGSLVLLLAVTAAVYARALGHGFLLTWDDDKYVAANEAIRGFTAAHLATAFTTTFVGNYAPVQILSYMLDYSVWGMRPAGFIATNLLLHLANGALCHRLFLRLGLGRLAAFLAAGVFLLHPVQVETVAWVSQRKNLLAMLFLLLAWHAYLRYREGGARLGYAASLASFFLAILAKPVAVVLPLILLLQERSLADDRGGRRRLDKLPYLLLAVAVGLFAVKAQDPLHGGGLSGYHGGSPLATLFTMLPVFCRYLGLILWPAGLSAVYAPTIHTSLDGGVVAAALCLAALAVGWRYLDRRDRRLSFWAGVAVIGILPVSQIVPLVTLMNDRYLYVPLLGVAALAGSAAARLARGAGGGRVPAAAVAALLLTPLAATSVGRVAAWHDDLTLWRDAVAKSPKSDEGWSGLGATLVRNGDIEGGIAAYERALAVNPIFSPALNNIADAYMRKGDLASARRYLITLTERYPQLVTGFMNLGLNYRTARQYGEAEAVYLHVLQLEPDTPDPRLALAELYLQAGRPDLARFYYGQAASRGADPAAVRQALGRIDALYGSAGKR
jgi:tetratricopeptide (TPR) repeat protein